MFCIGAVYSADAAMKSATDFARLKAMPASMVLGSGSSAVQRIASVKVGLADGPIKPSASRPASEITGPWRVARATSVTSGWPLTLMTSLKVSKAAQPFGVWYCDGSSGLMRSRYRSCTSGEVLVKPQATRSFWPSTTPGKPGIVAPATFKSGASMRARYHKAGA